MAGLPGLSEPGLAHRRRHRARPRGPAPGGGRRSHRGGAGKPCWSSTEKETVTLINMSPDPVDLTGFRLADILKHGCPVPAGRRAGSGCHVGGPYRQRHAVGQPRRSCQPAGFAGSEGSRRFLHRRPGPTRGMDDLVLTVSATGFLRIVPGSQEPGHAATPETVGRRLPLGDRRVLDVQTSRVLADRQSSSESAGPPGRESSWSNSLMR